MSLGGIRSKINNCANSTHLYSLLELQNRAARILPTVPMMLKECEDIKCNTVTLCELKPRLSVYKLINSVYKLRRTRESKHVFMN